MACKSMINTRLATATAVAAGGTVPLGSAVHGFGSGLALNGNAITIRAASAKSYFRILAHMTVQPTAAADITLSVLDGTSVLDYAIAVPTGAGDETDLALIATVYVKCACAGNHHITFTLDSAATVVDFAVEVEQI